MIRTLDYLMSKRCYVVSEPHLGGYRLVIGFESLADVQAAHELVERVRERALCGVPPTPAETGGEVSQSQEVDDRKRSDLSNPDRLSGSLTGGAGG